MHRPVLGGIRGLGVLQGTPLEKKQMHLDKQDFKNWCPVCEQKVKQVQRSSAEASQGEKNKISPKRFYECAQAVQVKISFLQS